MTKIDCYGNLFDGDDEAILESQVVPIEEIAPNLDFQFKNFAENVVNQDPSVSEAEKAENPKRQRKVTNE